MTQDERLLPVSPGREDRSLAEIAQTRAYGKYGRYGNQPETNVREYLHVILKRKWLILSLVLVITSLVTIQVYREPSIYQANTTVRIEAKGGSILQTGTALVINQTDPNFWGTQLKLLQNPNLARQVVLSLDLHKNPEFLGGQANGGIFSSVKRLLGREKTSAAKVQGEDAEPELVGEQKMAEMQLTAEQLAALEPYEDAIISGQVIAPVEKTNLVVIGYIHTNPDLAKQIADTLADVFVQNNVDRQELGISKAEITLAREISVYQERVKNDREKQFQFAKDNNLSLTATTLNLEAEKERGYAQQLLAAENERRDARAEYDAAKASDDLVAVPAVQKDEFSRELRKKLSELKERKEGLLQIYTEEWPEVKKITAQIKVIEADLKKAPEQVLASMKRRVESTEAKANSLARAYNQQHGKTTAQTKAEIELAAMISQLKTDEQYLNTLYQKQRELTATAGGGGTNVTIASKSRRGVLVGPARFRSIVLAFLLSLMAGVGLAFLLDFLDDSVKSIDDIDRYIHLPALALIPAARSEKGRLTAADAGAQNASAALTLVNDARSPMAEAYRHLRTSLLLSSAGKPPRTILVTSSQPSEGKTTTAVNTAFMLAQTGAEVLIIDCDLRRPRLHANFNVANTKGLTNFLSGECSIDDVLQTSAGVPNLKLLTSGPVPPNPAELLGSEQMRKLLEMLSERFAHVIVDSPPAISFTDASILSTFVDGVILVIHGGRSSRAVVRRAKQQLLDVGANIFGVVLNNVKAESHEYYGAGYYSSYYQSEYYEADDEGDNARAAAR
jgi:capsular exopolysaccharide synthesis family protein